MTFKRFVCIVLLVALTASQPMDSAFSGFVIEGLVERGDKTIVALFDCWFVQEGCTGREERRARCLEQC